MTAHQIANLRMQELERDAARRRARPPGAPAWRRRVGGWLVRTGERIAVHDTA